MNAELHDAIKKLALDLRLIRKLLNRIVKDTDNLILIAENMEKKGGEK